MNGHASLCGVRLCLSIGWLVLVVGTCSADGRGQQASSLEEGAKKCAGMIENILRDLSPREKELFIRDFRTSGGSNVGITKAIGDALTREKYTVVKGAKTEVEGRVSRIPPNQKEPTEGYVIEGRVITADNRKKEFVVNVKNPAEAAIFTGETGELERPPTPGARPAMAAPTVVGRELRPSPDSPYGIEILVADANGDVLVPLGKDVTKRYRLCEITVGTNGPKVELRRGDTYAIRVHNRSDFGAVASVYIDGLSRYAFGESETARKIPGLALDPKEATEIAGYYLTSNRVAAFVVGGYENSAVAQKLPDSLDIGTIAVSFRTAWEEGGKIPIGDEAFKGLTEINATHRGPELVSESELVQRYAGTLRAVVKVRY